MHIEPFDESLEHRRILAYDPVYRGIFLQLCDHVRRALSRIHLCHRGDPVHADSLAFIDVLMRRPDLRRRYEEAKHRAHAIDPVNPEVYNRAREAVINQIHLAGRTS